MGIFRRIKQFCFVDLRIRKYQFLSNCRNIVGKPKLYVPVLLNGMGKISFGENVQIGVVDSPNYYSGYSYFEARYLNSQIIIGNSVSINNAFSVVSFSKVTIEDHVLIGTNCSIIDSDAHHLDADKRNTGLPKSDEVLISKNVFIGSNVTILKGVTIGKNSVIGNGAVVAKSIPDNVIAAGNPARVIRNL